MEGEYVMDRVMAAEHCLLGERLVRTRVLMRSWPGHEEGGCECCPHPVFESYYEDTGEIQEPLVWREEWGDEEVSAS